MYRNGNKYDKFYRNGILYQKGMLNDHQIFGSTGMQVRYIRDYCGGSTTNGAAVWAEIQAFENGANVALNKIATINTTVTPENGGDSYPANTSIPNITDGDTSAFDSVYTDINGNVYNCTVDLGAPYMLTGIKVWHYPDGRTHHNTKTQVSADGLNWITVFDSTISGEYPETPEGHEIIL